MQINAPDFAGSVVIVEIARQLGMFRTELHGFAIAEMFLHIGARTQQPFLFAAPQAHADSAVHIHIERFENADGLHHHRAAGRVVGCASAAVPRIQMRAQHDNLVFLSAARNFCNHVD